MWTLQRFLLQDCFIQVDQRQLSWTSAVTLIKEADCSRGLSYSSLNILWVTGGYKPTERKAKQSPATGLWRWTFDFLLVAAGEKSASLLMKSSTHVTSHCQTHKLWRDCLDGKSGMEKAGFLSPLVRKVSYMMREEAGTWHPGNCVCLPLLVSLGECAQLPASKVEFDFEK